MPLFWRGRKGVDRMSRDKGGAEGAEGVETIIRIHRIKKSSIFNNNKKNLTKLPAISFPRLKTFSRVCLARVLQIFGMGSDSQTRFSVIWLLGPLQPLLMAYRWHLAPSLPRHSGRSLCALLLRGNQDLMFYSHPAGSQAAPAVFTSCSPGLLYLSVSTLSCVPSAALHSVLELLRHGLTVSVNWVLTWASNFRFLCPRTAHFLREFFVWGSAFYCMCVSQNTEHPSSTPTRCQ